MRYLWFVLEYTCPMGHPNTLNKYIEEPIGGVTDAMIQSRLSAALPCSVCPLGSISAPSSPEQGRVKVRTHLLTAEQFAELGIAAEPWDVPSQ